VSVQVVTIVSGLSATRTLLAKTGREVNIWLGAGWQINEGCRGSYGGRHSCTTQISTAEHEWLTAFRDDQFGTINQLSWCMGRRLFL